MVETRAVLCCNRNLKFMSVALKKSQFFTENRDNLALENTGFFSHLTSNVTCQDSHWLHPTPQPFFSSSKLPSPHLPAPSAVAVLWVKFPLYEHIYLIFTQSNTVSPQTCPTSTSSTECIKQPESQFNTWHWPSPTVKWPTHYLGVSFEHWYPFEYFTSFQQSNKIKYFISEFCQTVVWDTHWETSKAKIQY